MDLQVMQKLKDNILSIDLDHICPGLILEIIPELHCSFPKETISDADQYGESPYQLLEGHSYEYEFIGTNSKDYTLQAKTKGIVSESRRHAFRGRICPNIYVGRLNLVVINVINSIEYPLFLEVIATKFNKKQDHSYRNNYRKMLEDITSKCADLLLQINTPIIQNFTIDFNKNTKTIYQRFCFVKSFVDNPEFEEAISRIIANPSTQWRNTDKMVNCTQIRRVDRNIQRQLVSGTSRMDTSKITHLKNIGLSSIPSNLITSSKQENIDTPENRFIKHALSVFLNFIEQCLAMFERDSNFQHAQQEAIVVKENLSRHLFHSFFENISQANTLSLNSPLLHKRNGYREVLNKWLQFDLAAKLIWDGGQDVYEAGKRDIATLYEYWLFFELYELLIEKFKLEKFKNKNLEQLFETTNQGLSLKLKAGKETILKGQTQFEHRNLSMRFSYNRTFKGGNHYLDGTPGSITTTLRPDYSLSIWPSDYTEREAEQKGIIVHIHFDAKYKIQNIQEQYTTSDNIHYIDNIKIEERKGTFKNIDILKMHAYKDAIRRTGGAYILYPGRVEKQFEGFHEVLPGLGAFTITPSLSNTGIKGLSNFIDNVIIHLIDKTTQREQISTYSNNILKNPPNKYRLKQ